MPQPQPAASRVTPNSAVPAQDLEAAHLTAVSAAAPPSVNLVDNPTPAATSKKPGTAGAAPYGEVIARLMKEGEYEESTEKNRRVAKVPEGGAWVVDTSISHASNGQEYSGGLAIFF